MDPRFHIRGFAANPNSIALKNLGNYNICSGEAGDEGRCNADTTLRLDSYGSETPFSSTPKGMKRKWSILDGPRNQHAGFSLDLCLGHSSSSSDSKGSTGTMSSSISSAKETEEESPMDLELDFTLHLGGDKSSNADKSTSSNVTSLNVFSDVDLQLGISHGPTLSDITAVHPSIDAPENCNEGSIRGGFIAFQTGQSSGIGHLMNQPMEQKKPTSPGLSSSIITMQKSSVTCTSGISQPQQHQQQQRTNGTKQCQFQGCLKGARGASGLCIAHGGGRRCQRSGCHKGAEGRTAFCKAHGGGRRCEFLGCTKSAEGRTDFCIAHGGGRRCSHEGCTRAARGRSGLCIRHGGGKRCQRENCTKSAEGLSGLCISHGGGRRCQYPECSKGAQGSTMFCKAHGGGKRCTYPGCNKGAEGSTSFCKGHGGGKRCSYQGGGICPKSVHGGTLFCVAHGGGKRCAVAECTKSARGRTDFCVRHGGGKRCKFDGCGKSAQGSTDFCKAHGGGKRCLWGHPGSELGRGDVPCNTFARGKIGLCASHGALIMDKRVHGGATAGIVFQDSKTSTNEDMSVDTSEWNSCNPTPEKVPEGRVHGGNLMAMLAKGPGFEFK